MTGRHIKTILDDYRDIGNYEIDISASDLAKGLYIIQLDGEVTSSKNTLLNYNHFSMKYIIQKVSVLILMLFSINNSTYAQIGQNCTIGSSTGGFYGGGYSFPGKYDCTNTCVMDWSQMYGGTSIHGDGTCHDGSVGFGNFNCSQFNYDGGDCVNGCTTLHILDIIQLLMFMFSLLVVHLKFMDVQIQIIRNIILMLIGTMVPVLL